MLRIPSGVRRFARVFSDHGFELYVVGGAVRDALLGNALDDYDFATSATPDEVTGLFRRVLPTGIRHGTVSVLFEKYRFEVTTYRVEGGYSDHRHPDSVEFTRSLADDLSRRDFTVNAIALDPQSGRIIDPLGGQTDLKRRCLRTVGKAQDRFTEDALRMIRAVRFHTVLDFDVEQDVLDAIRDEAHLIDNVAPERIAAELEKMMSARYPSRGWVMLKETGLLGRIIPELEEDRRIDVPIFPHLVQCCDCAPPENSLLRWAALLHDIGKPRCIGKDSRGLHFHGHDEESARMCNEILTRLRFSTERITGVAHLVRHHMFGYTREWSDAALRRFIVRVGKDQVSLLTALRRADGCGKSGRAPVDPDLDELESRLDLIMRDSPPLDRADLKLNGKELMDELQIPPGPAVGIILDELLQTVLDDPEKNRRETLLLIARRLYEQRLKV